MLVKDEEVQKKLDTVEVANETAADATAEVNPYGEARKELDAFLNLKREEKKPKQEPDADAKEANARLARSVRLSLYGYPQA